MGGLSSTRRPVSPSTSAGVHRKSRPYSSYISTSSHHAHGDGLRMVMFLASIFDNLFLHRIHNPSLSRPSGPNAVQKESALYQSRCSIAPPLHTRISASGNINRISAGVGSKRWLSIPAGTTMVSSILSPAIDAENRNRGNGVTAI